jgi:hydrogenase/urease accessory protein HupE
VYKIFFFLLFEGFLFGHQTGLSFVEISEDTKHKVSIIYKKPLSDLKGKEITINYPKKCVLTKELPLDISSGFITQKSTMWCGEKGLSGSRIWIEGLLRKDRGVLIRYKYNDTLTQSLIRESSPVIFLNYKNSSWGLFKEYVRLGIEHILSGYDHLSFVFALLLLALNYKRLLFAISAFTLSHSITLAFGIFGIVKIGVPYVEAMIALSILFLAREIMIKKDTFTKKHLGITAFTFGLLHGLGFSTVLRSLGLPQDDLVLALVAFNVGIEIGQLLFILAVSFLLLLLRRRIGDHQEETRKILAYGIGTLSAYWFIERVLAF